MAPSESHKTCQAALVKVLGQRSKINKRKDHIMTKPISTSEQGLKPHYRVWVVVSNPLLHLASWTEPKIDQDLTTRVEGGWIDDHQYNETIGLINWEAITAITWR